MSTPGLGLPHLTPSQTGKSDSVNVIGDGLDGALTQQSTIDMTGSVDVTPLAAVLVPFMVLNLTGVIGAAINLVLSNLPGPHLFLIANNTTGAYIITVKQGAGTTVDLNSGDIKLVYCDGVNCFKPN